MKSDVGVKDSPLDVADRLLIDAVVKSDYTLGPWIGPDGSNGLSGEFGYSTPPLACHVHEVLTSGADPKVLGSDTSANIACVAYIKAARYWSYPILVGPPVRVFPSRSPVSVAPAGAHPNPAVIRDHNPIEVPGSLHRRMVTNLGGWK